MSKLNKLINRFYAERPPVDITWAELVVIAEAFDCYPLQKSRHRAIAHRSNPKWVFPIPVHSDGEPIKRAYIMELRELFREIRPEVIEDEI